MAFAPLVLALVIGAIVGVCRGGHVAALSGVRFASLSLVVMAVISSVATEHLDLPAPGWIALGSLVMALAFAFRNIRLAGMAVVSVGIIANLVPLVVNGATPVRPEALVEAGMVNAADLEHVTLSGPYELSDADTPRLPRWATRSHCRSPSRSCHSATSSSSSASPTFSPTSWPGVGGRPSR